MGSPKTGQKGQTKLKIPFTLLLKGGRKGQKGGCNKVKILERKTFSGKIKGEKESRRFLKIYARSKLLI